MGSFTFALLSQTKAINTFSFTLKRFQPFWKNDRSSSCRIPKIVNNAKVDPHESYPELVEADHQPRQSDIRQNFPEQIQGLK